MRVVSIFSENLRKKASKHICPKRQTIPLKTLIKSYKNLCRMWIKHHWLHSKGAFLMQKAGSWIWQHIVFHNRVLLMRFQGSCSVVSAQRHGAGHVSLVSRGSQQRAFIEAGTANLMTCMKVGVRNMWTQILPYHLGSQPVSAPRKPELEDSEFQEPIQTRHREGLPAPSRSSEKPEPGAELHMLICTAERGAPAGVKAGLRLGLGQI